MPMPASASGDIRQRQQARQADGARPLLLRDRHGDLVIQARRRAQARGAIVGPEDANECLILGSLRRGIHAVAAEALHFVECFRVLVRSHRRRRRRAELRGTGQHKRSDLTPMCTERDAIEADRILPPVTGVVAGVVVHTQDRLRVMRAVVGALVEDRVGGSLAQSHAVQDRYRGIAQPPQAVLQFSVERRFLRREQCDERVVRGVRHGGLRGHLAAHARQTGVAPVAAVDRDECIEHCDLHDRDRARRATWTDLLAEHAVFPRRHGRVIDAARVDRNFIPVNDPAPQVAAGRRIAEDRRRRVGYSFMRDTEGVVERRRSLGEGNERN
jgi:hypothetical protein